MILVRRSIALLLLALGLFAQERPAPVKLLTIGNSFAGNSTFYLRELSEAEGAPIAIIPVNLGGCDLARHARHLKAYYQDPASPEGRPYRDAARRDKAAYSLVEALESESPDYVTLQQFSGDSYKPETYEPHAGELVAAVRNHAPLARIVVLQTWAYRGDNPILAKEGLTQQEMFERLVRAYDKLAGTYGLGILPVGEAFQIARMSALWRFVHPDPAFDYGNPAPDSLPDQRGSLIAGWSWRKDAKTEQRVLALDAKHANAAGRYLGACVLFMALTGRDALSISWRPPELTAPQAESLRQAAHLAVFARRAAAETH